MRTTQFFLSTLKEAPSDAEIISHQLMLRAGLIQQLMAGAYSYLPLGYRALSTAAVAPAQRAGGTGELCHRRADQESQSESSRSRIGFGFAPMTCFTSSPFL